MESVEALSSSLLASASAHEGHSEHEEIENIKVGSLVGLFFLSLICSYLPWMVRKRSQNSANILSHLNALAGGISLGVVFNYLLPEARSSFVKWDPTVEYPLAETISALVLLILLAIDVVYQSSSISKSSAIPHHHHHHYEHGEIQENESNIKESCCPVVADFDDSKEVELPHVSQPGVVCNEQLSEESEEAKTFKKEDAEVNEKPLAIVVEEPLAKSEHKHSPAASAARAMVFMFALSIHSFLEGAGLGVQDEMGGVVATVIAIFAHKALEAFALGSSIENARFSKWKSIALVLFYAAMTPSGIGLGLGLASTDTSAPSAILLSLACGSFFYISLLELIPTELSQPRGKISKMALIFIGYGAIAGILGAAGHSHAEEGHQGH